MENINVSDLLANITVGDALGWVLAAAAAIITLSKVLDIITARLKPQKELQDKVREHDEMLKRDKRRLEQQDEANAVIFRALYAQINHEISGNGDDILRRSRDEIQNYLTNR